MGSSCTCMFPGESYNHSGLLCFSCQGSVFFGLDRVGYFISKQVAWIGKGRNVPGVPDAFKVPWTFSVAAQPRLTCGLSLAAITLPLSLWIKEFNSVKAAEVGLLYLGMQVLKACSAQLHALYSLTRAALECYVNWRLARNIFSLACHSLAIFISPNADFCQIQSTTIWCTEHLTGWQSYEHFGVLTLGILISWSFSFCCPL